MRKVILLSIIISLVLSGCFHEKDQVVEDANDKNIEETQDINKYDGVKEDENEKINKVVNDQVNQEDETADWQTYRNEEYGFELEYPSDWRLVGSEKFFGFGPELIREDVLFTISIVDKIPSIGIDSINNNKEVTEIEDTIFNDLQGKKVYIKNIYVDKIYTRIFIDKEGYILSIGQPTINEQDYPFDKKYNKNINQILSTFKFTN